VPGIAVADAITLNGGTLQITAGTPLTLHANRGITLDTNGGTFSVDASKSLNYAGIIAGTGGLTKSGSGTMTLSGASTYSGGATISAGTLKVGIASVGSVGAVTSGALGTGTTTVASGAALDLNGMTIPNAMSVAGTGISSGGSLFNTAATAASVTGPITLSANSTFISTPGLTLGTINGGLYALTVTASTAAGTGDITLNGPVTFSGENISTFTASRNININNTITVNGTTSASGIALKFSQGATNSGDYNFGLTASGAGVGMTASFAGSINFANTASTFSTQNYTAAAKSYTLVDSFTTAAPSTSTFYCVTTTHCGGSNAVNFALAGDINATGFTAANMRAVGPTNNVGYAGIFEGLGHKINNLTLSGSGNVALFQSTAANAEIRNLRLSAANISGGSYTGALVANTSSSLKITNVVLDSTSSVTGGSSDNVGGLVGRANGGGSFTNVYVLGTSVNGGGYVGGVAGYTTMSATNVHKVGNVTATGTYVGGAFGYISATLSNVDSQIRAALLESVDSSVTLPTARSAMHLPQALLRQRLQVKSVV
jgi:autotransporter-associated beta strand protein